jgi:hypothetical protein
MGVTTRDSAKEKGRQKYLQPGCCVFALRRNHKQQLEQATKKILCYPQPHLPTPAVAVVVVYTSLPQLAEEEERRSEAKQAGFENKVPDRQLPADDSRILILFVYSIRSLSLI